MERALNTTLIPALWLAGVAGGFTAEPPIWRRATTPFR